MRIGLDFDNTIVSYDSLFHRVALEQGAIPASTPVNKLAVRDYLRKIDQEDRWTEMQGYVYGARMDEAEAYPGVINFIRAARDAGHTLAIMSHKTRHPFMGPQYDLHSAARNWIAHHLQEDGEALIPTAQVFFELTKQEKIARIADFGCDVFIDDLPEILLAADFPKETERFLFDPEEHHKNAQYLDLILFLNWGEIARRLLA